MICGDEGEYVELERTVKQITIGLKNGNPIGHFDITEVGLVKILGKVFLRFEWETKTKRDFKMIELSNIEDYHIVVDKEKQCDVYNLENGHITQKEFEELNNKRIERRLETKEVIT